MAVRKYIDMNIWERPVRASNPTQATTLPSGVPLPLGGNPYIISGEMNIPAIIQNPRSMGSIEINGLGGDERQKRPLVSNILPTVPFDGSPSTQFIFTKIPKWFLGLGVLVDIVALDSGLTGMTLSNGTGMGTTVIVHTSGKRLYSLRIICTGSSYVYLSSAAQVALTDTIIKISYIGVRLWDAVTLD
jgi:hypothetical protein